MSELISRNGADSVSYIATETRKRRTLDTSQGPRVYMRDALIAEGTAPTDDTERPAAVPVITPEIVQENYRRVAAGAKNTLVRVLPDGKREYFHDVVVRDSDGIRDTLGTDRGHGTTDSLRMLREEGAVKVEGLLDKRGADGRFKKGG